MSPPQPAQSNGKAFQPVVSTSESLLTRLRAGVYNAPDVPSTFYESILEYLKTTLNLNYTSLIYESTEANTTAQIESHEVDLAWVSYQKYFELVEARKVARLLPVSTVHTHPKNNREAGESFGVFSDVVVHSCLKPTVKEMFDLRGHRWAYTGPASYAGHGITIEKLKAMGESAAFFGDLLPARSHSHCLEMILQRQVDAAAVDSTALRHYLEANSHQKEQLQVLTSWGPLPPAAILVNSHIGAEAEKLIVETLLAMHTTQKGRQILNQYSVQRFAMNSADNYAHLARGFIKKPPGRGVAAVSANGGKQFTAAAATPLMRNLFESPYY